MRDSMRRFVFLRKQAAAPRTQVGDLQVLRRRGRKRQAQEDAAGQACGRSRDGSPRAEAFFLGGGHVHAVF